MQRLLLSPVFLLVFIGSVYAALSFPTLTGRVVDEAGILSASGKNALEQTLANYEAQSTNQVVVVTLRSLRGTTIEDYGYQLGRTWGIGQKDKNNGVLLIVAPKERKVRIEVGYGLEGTLTDAMSSDIIHNTILPEFRTGHMEQGVIDGTHAILSILNNENHEPDDYATAAARNYSSQSVQNPPTPGDLIASILILGLFCVLFVLVCWNNPAALLAASYIGSGRSFGGGSGGGGFGGGFSGGGGSFGGGGASGGW